MVYHHFTDKDAYGLLTKITACYVDNSRVVLCFTVDSSTVFAVILKVWSHKNLTRIISTEIFKVKIFVLKGAAIITANFFSVK